MSYLKKIFFILVLATSFFSCENKSDELPVQPFQPCACECRDWASEIYYRLDSTERTIRHFKSEEKEYYDEKINQLKSDAIQFDSLLNVCEEYLHQRIECIKPLSAQGYYVFVHYFFSDLDTSLFLKYDKIYSGNWHTDSINLAYTKHDIKMMNLYKKVYIDSASVTPDEWTYYDSVQDSESEMRLEQFKKMLEYTDSMHPFNRMLFRKSD